MNATLDRDNAHLKKSAQFESMPEHVQRWVLASPHATEAFSEFFDKGGRFAPNPDNGLPYFTPTNPPTIAVDQAQWTQLQAPDAAKYPQRHLFGTLAHEIGHDRFNTGNILFKGGSADDYVQYRAGLEAQAIFTAFPIFKDLEKDPAFAKEFPFGSIGYLNGLELGTLYKSWRSGELDDKTVVDRIAAKVPASTYTLGNPPADLNQDGAITHRDAYLRDYRRMIDQRPEMAKPPQTQPQISVSAPTDLNEHDQRMLDQIRSGALTALQGTGRTLDGETLERLSHCLLAECKDGRDRHTGAHDYSYSSNALNRVDHVVTSKDGLNLFAVEGRLGDPAAKFAVVSVDKAIQTPIELSDQKLLAANQSIAQERASIHQQGLGLDQGDPSRGGPMR